MPGMQSQLTGSSSGDVYNHGIQVSASEISNIIIPQIYVATHAKQSVRSPGSMLHHIPTLEVITADSYTAGVSSRVKLVTHAMSASYIGVQLKPKVHDHFHYACVCPCSHIARS